MDWVKFPTPPLVERHLITNCVLVALTLIIVTLRIWSRILSGAKLWWDDYLILFALPQGIGMLAIQGMWATMGEGHPTVDTLPNLMSILKMLIAYELLFTTSITTVKLSVLFFYLRVFVNKGLRLAVKFTMGFVMLWTAGNILQVFLICRPFAATYDITLRAECGDQVASYIAIGCFNVVTDLIVLTLPIPTVWSLQMPKMAKTGITGIFLIGLVVSVVAIIRIDTLASDLHVELLTQTMIWPAFWSTFEVNLAILCVSTPMLGAVWSRCAGRSESTAKLSGGVSSDNANGSTIGRPLSSFKSKIMTKKGQQKCEDEELALESIYASNQRVHYESAVACTRSGSVDDAGSGRSDISQVALTSESKVSGQDIKVHTKWTITHDKMEDC